MVGKFDQELALNGGVVTVQGPVLWDAKDAGRTVRIEARLDQNGEHDHCHMDIVAPNQRKFPQSGVWSMPLQTNKIGPGPVEAHAVATCNGRIIDQWDQPPEQPLPVTVV
jgi:hypothetical protein